MTIAMPFNPLPLDPLPRVLDTARLAALHDTGLLDSDPEAAFDRITHLAGRLLGVPTVAVSLVDSNRQFFKSAMGLPPPVAACRESPLSHSLCQYVVGSGKPLCIPDAFSDPVWKRSGAVTEWKTGAYLGVPLRVETPNGPQVVGALCVLDGVPRNWTNHDTEILEDFAALVETEMRLRQALSESIAHTQASRDALLALLQSETRFRGVTECSPLGIFVTNASGMCVYANPKLTEITGSGSEAELLSNGFFRTLYSADRETVLQKWQTALREQSAFSSVHRLVRQDGAGRVVWVSVQAAPLLPTLGFTEDASGVSVAHGWAGTVEDVSEQKAAEEALLTLTQELKRSNDALQEFAGVASHDLQEPLRKVLTFGDRLKSRSGADLSDEGAEYLNRMLGAAARMQTLLDDLLLYSRVSSKAQRFRPVALDGIAGGVVQDLEARLHETGGVVVLGDLPTLDADPLQMRQLLQNLISNALKFHRPDVPPQVTVSSQMVTEPGKENRQLCRISIQDNGIGFDNQYAVRIFEVFERLHNRTDYEGTGMGLAICRKIVHRHGGTIVAESAMGHGARFMVTLPMQHAAPDAPDAPLSSYLIEPAPHSAKGHAA